MTMVTPEQVTRTCRWCGMIHGERCPIVKALEFNPDGSVERVEFITDADAPPWPRSRAI